MFFCKLPEQRFELTFVRLQNGVWSAPQLALFADTMRGDSNPWYSSSGDTLYFTTQDLQGLWFIGYVTRVGDGWSARRSLPVTLPAGAIWSAGGNFSFSRDGTLYAGLTVSGDADIYRWRKQGGGYTTPEHLGGSINSASMDFAPFVDPEERFLLFSSTRPGGLGRTDIYISRAQAGGGWGEAVNLGPQVNWPEDDLWPAISPDGKYLFFVSRREPGLQEPLWVDARVLDGLGS